MPHLPRAEVVWALVIRTEISLHTSALWRVAGDCETFGPGRRGRLRLLRQPFPLLLEHAPYLVATVEGMPVAWCLANPNLDEREVMAAILEVDHHLVTEGQVILADKGFAGANFEAFLDQLGVHLARPARKGVDRAPPHPPNALCCACGNGSKRSSTR